MANPRKRKLKKLARARSSTPVTEPGGAPPKPIVKEAAVQKVKKSLFGKSKKEE